MFGSNSDRTMDRDQMNRCVKRYSFLSPKLSSSFSNYSQKTECDLSSSSASDSEQKNPSPYILPGKQNSMLFRLFSPWRASCEAAQRTAIDRMERAQESLKQMDATRSGIVISEVEIQNFLAKETGRDRLLKMYTRDHTGESSPEFKLMYQVTVQAGAVTFLVMSTLAGRQAKQEFIDRNRATVFKTRFQAFRRMQDSIFLFSLKEGAKWTARVSLFTLSILGISQSIAVYRNKSSAWEYSVAAGLTMGMLKANMGLKAFVASSGIGAVAGLVMGFAMLGAMRGLNETQEQRHYWQVHRELERERFYQLKGQPPDTATVETA